jgi:hypothetical protein
VTPARRALASRAGGRARPPLDLIHRSNCSKPASMRVCGRFGGNRPSGVSTVSYDVERGDSQAVLDCVVALLMNLEAGVYGRL